VAYLKRRPPGGICGRRTPKANMAPPVAIAARTDLDEPWRPLSSGRHGERPRVAKVAIAAVGGCGRGPGGGSGGGDGAVMDGAPVVVVAVGLVVVVMVGFVVAVLPQDAWFEDEKATHKSDDDYRLASPGSTPP